MVEGRTEARVLSLTNVQDYGPRDGSVWSDGFDERIMSERLRLQHLESSRGEEAARTWAAGTAKLYLAITRDPHHYASHAEWQPRFQHSIRDLEQFVRPSRVPQ
ncbi:hypothetical protein YTPLAS18_15110 [Nitrospira sp.]|nr:hypothetical protein YTPLAS18_15110 [Nitrospira sp.]